MSYRHNFLVVTFEHLPKFVFIAVHRFRLKLIEIVISQELQQPS